MFNEIINSILSYCAMTKKTFNIDTLTDIVYDELSDSHYTLNVFDIFIAANTFMQVDCIFKHIERRLKLRKINYTTDTDTSCFGMYEKSFSMEFSNFNTILEPLKVNRLNIFIASEYSYEVD